VDQLVGPDHTGKKPNQLLIGTIIDLKDRDPEGVSENYWFNWT
jgi:hypothetical protein